MEDYNTTSTPDTPTDSSIYETTQLQEQYQQQYEQIVTNNGAYDASSYKYGADGLPAIVWVIYFALLAVMLVSAWKVFTKAGKPGWAAIVPIYNAYIMTQIVGRPWWWLLLLLVPFVNIVVSIIITNDLAKSFGKTVGWTVGLIFLPFIFYPMLAFGSAKYHGPAAAPRTAA